MTGAATVQGNVIGPSASGTAVPTGSVQRIGVHIDGTGSTIGGSAPGAGNVIAGHTVALGTGTGIEVFGLRTATIQGNTIGLTAAGTRRSPTTSGSTCSAR